MVYLIVKNGVIENSIVCDDEQTASFFGAVPSYIGAKIGDKYKPSEESTMDENMAFNSLLDAIIQ